MTEKQFEEFRKQYPDAVILERIEEENDNEIAVKYAAYGDDAIIVIGYAAGSFFFDYSNKQVDGNLFKKLVFDAQFLENVVRGLTHNLKRVVFVKCSE